MGLDMWTFPSCMCSQVFYNSLVSCGNACNIPVDEPVKYESDCEIGNHPVNINGGGGQEFYNNLVSCGNACNIPVDEPIKYESDCEIGNHPVNINGGGGGDERVKIVHLIAHSQGYTIVVLVIRILRLELSYTGDQGCLSKLSVHAFSDLSRGFRNLGNQTIQDPAIMRGIINEISYVRFGATTGAASFK
ncbi:14610_t:CDS:2 [Funneliformis mosseae]|uniref:14610_t:CDS:1 n=1 Tax=Funneliformis mosseae TaxID=27381 RepID=A0A9N8ZJM3_FUNMO|nr:14610_t:CDS:2 [Funneliformis mosseae]